jgi:hypothetical protein
MTAKRLPWWANVDKTVRDGHSYEVCLLSHEDHDNMDTARLIAAAPDLLVAAENALARLEKGAPGWGVAKDVLRAAIYKARNGGDQPR